MAENAGLRSGGVTGRLAAVCGALAAVTGIYQRDFSSKMTIVAFHRVNDQLPEDGITCGARKFEAFCAFFRKYFRVLPLSEQIAGCREGRNLGGTLSITFDDGYLDNFEVAAPILKNMGLPATFFVTTGFIGSPLTAPWDRHLPHPPGWMSWDQLRSLAALGFEIGNHTDTHIDMAKSTPEQVRTELAASKRKLAEVLGARAQLFAYPFGGREHITPEARELVRELGFACCMGCYGGVNTATPDPFRLNRIGIGEWFARPHQFGFDLLRWKPEA